MLTSIGNIALLAFGFGFVIFFHELGHFLAAKWADVKVEQFAVGFGQAMISWRKGLGFRVGSSTEEYQSKLLAKVQQTTPGATGSLAEAPTFVSGGSDGPELPGTLNDLQTDDRPQHLPGDPTDEQLDRAARELGISETEYRLNWIPLGGYVKMLGQDDLRPNSLSPDPRSYNSKPVSKRMVIVSAGVVMNIILAAIGFMYIFLAGFDVAPPQVGGVVPGSPAEHTYKMVDGKKTVVPLQPGDLILSLNNKPQADFEKIALNVALSTADEPIPLDVKHVDGTTERLTIVPQKVDSASFPMLGLAPPHELKGADIGAEPLDADEVKGTDALLLKNGDTITAIAGKPVKPDQFWMLDRAIEEAGGNAVPVTITNAKGVERSAAVKPEFNTPFGIAPINFDGLLMRPVVKGVQKGSPAGDKLKPDDIIVSIADSAPNGDRAPVVTREEMMKWTNEAGQKGTKLDLVVIRGGKRVDIKGISPSMRVTAERYGMGVELTPDEDHAVVAGALPDSPAAAVPAGAAITSVNGKPVKSWFDVNAALAALTPTDKVTLVASVDGKDKTFTLPPLDADQLSTLRQNRFTTTLLMSPLIAPRKTSNPITAAKWGIGETRDAILQVYQTVRAMVSGSVSYKQVSGPVGIFAAGYKFAEMGVTRLVWFLSIISANLAVMNFLPIPIVDGGLFTFLIIEKIRGKAVSPRVLAVAQFVGLAILLSVFLLATYQDVFNRLPFLNR